MGLLDVSTEQILDANAWAFALGHGCKAFGRFFIVSVTNPKHKERGGSK
jgi:hypothetical protein